MYFKYIFGKLLLFIFEYFFYKINPFRFSFYIWGHTFMIFFSLSSLNSHLIKNSFNRIFVLSTYVFFLLYADSNTQIIIKSVFEVRKLYFSEDWFLLKYTLHINTSSISFLSLSNAYSISFEQSLKIILLVLFKFLKRISKCHYVNLYQFTSFWLRFN